MSVPVKKIKKISFEPASPDYIRRISVVEVTSSDIYDEDGFPKRKGLSDRRLGLIEPYGRCETCGCPSYTCPGHFGHIELARPVIHPLYAKKIHEILSATCRRCSRILLPKEVLKRYYRRMREYYEKNGFLSEEIAKEVVQKAKNVKYCPHCGAEQYKITLVGATSFYEKTPYGEELLLPAQIRQRLTLIPDEDARLLGVITRPEYMVLTVLPVPPPAVRPSVFLESGERAEDDLTHKLTDIIRINNRLRENIEAGAPQIIVEDLSNLLQYHVTTYIDNSMPGIPPAKHRSGRPLKGIAQRLEGKMGRFRKNLVGKRVNFSARTVISPDPYLEIDEVGVPIEIAKILTVPERVTEYNIEKLRKLIMNGADKYPGVNYIIRPDGRKRNLRFIKDPEKLKKIAESIEPGYIVERHLMDGDIVLFNRQPSLHRLSMMAHRVRVLPYKTFRLHLFVCPPYNADFDGDEMNLHVPQAREAQAEARLLMNVINQILTPRYGGPIMGALHDFITSAYLLTKKTTLLTKKEVWELLANIGYTGPLPEPAIRKPKELWTGKQIFSILLPEGLTYSLKAKVCEACEECKKENCPYDAYVLVINGKLLLGVIDKKSIGPEQPESILHVIAKDYGNEFAAEFLNKLSRILLSFLDRHGFSIAPTDIDVPEEAKRVAKKKMDEIKRKVQELIEIYKRGELKRLPGHTLRETLEMKIMQILAEGRDSLGEIISRYIKRESPTALITRTGARGNPLNITQTAACLGQQSIRGERVLRGFKHRTLSHFKQHDLGPEAHGFVFSNYKDGLTPLELFFHAMGGRESLVDTAVRTSQSGYMYRRLLYALEDLYVDYDGTVRDADRNIIQFKYGGDGISVAKSDHGKAVNVKKIVEAVLMTEGAK